MKVFWLFVVMMVGGGFAFLAFSASREQRQKAAVVAEQAKADADASETLIHIAPTRQPVATPEPAPQAPEPKVESTEAPAPSTPVVAPQSAPVAATQEVKPFPTENPPVATPTEAPVANATKAAEATTQGGTVGAKAGAFDVVESKIEAQPDGSMLIDGALKVTGTGTAVDPYVIPWELLISAEKTYNPSDKLTKIPSAVAMLDGKYVRITGYVAFPMYVQQATELLSMLNQWDGCCIGVPPTPYDAIEVQLKAVVGEEDRMATFGEVQGRFGVKPYVVGDWLVGLYVMEEGELKAKRFNGLGT
jgi:hypothetical protein